MIKKLVSVCLVILLMTGLIPAQSAFAAEKQETEDRYYSFVTSSAEKKNGGKCVGFSIDGNQLTRTYYFEDGKKVESTSNLTFTDASMTMSYWDCDASSFGSVRVTIHYDANTKEYYFPKKQEAYRRNANAQTILSNTYAPEKCLDTGEKNLITNLQSETISRYGYTKEQLDKSLSAIQDGAQKITAGCKSDYEKIKTIGTWMVDNLTYAKEPGNYTGYPYEEVANPYIIWDTKKAVCFGYAQLSEVMLQAVGIPCITVRGNRGGSHVWNMVYIDGDWRYFDPTNLGSKWMTAFLVDIEYASTAYPSFYFSFLPNLQDGGVTYATQLIKVYGDISKVTLDAQGGQTNIPAIYTASYASGHKDYYINLETVEPKKRGHSFAGWYETPDCSGPEITRNTIVKKAGDHTLYAKWKLRPVR